MHSINIKYSNSYSKLNQIIIILFFELNYSLASFCFRFPSTVSCRHGIFFSVANAIVVLYCRLVVVCVEQSLKLVRRFGALHEIFMWMFVNVLRRMTTIYDHDFLLYVVTIDHVRTYLLKPRSKCTMIPRMIWTFEILIFFFQNWFDLFDCFEFSIWNWFEFG